MDTFMLQQSIFCADIFQGRNGDETFTEETSPLHVDFPANESAITEARAALAESMVSLGIVIAHAKEKLRAAELLHADNDLLRQAVKLPIKEAREAV
jgi:hypothetical protein